MNLTSNDIIVARATPPGQGGVGIIRISGKGVAAIANSLIGSTPKPRMATFCNFLDHEGNAIDQGLAIYFKAPNSFTGEDILELHGHGGTVVLDLLLKTSGLFRRSHGNAGGVYSPCLLNDKIDLAQAEAIADLIEASSEQAARCAVASYKGDFRPKLMLWSRRPFSYACMLRQPLIFPRRNRFLIRS